MNVRVVRNRFLERRSHIFRLRKSKCPITFLKILVRALHFWIKHWVFIESIWFFISDNIENVLDRILRKYKKRSPKRSPSISSKFEPLNISNKFYHFVADLTYQTAPNLVKNTLKMNTPPPAGGGVCFFGLFFV